jgi:hypothetical protein
MHMCNQAGTRVVDERERAEAEVDGGNMQAGSWFRVVEVPELQ